MVLYRIGPEGFWVVSLEGGAAQRLLSDPWTTPIEAWQLGSPVEIDDRPLLAPVQPGKIIGVGRNYRAHAAELGNPMPEEPLLFLKAPSSLIGPSAPIVLPVESQDVHFEGEIALVIGARVHRPSIDEARAAIFGVTGACDVTARDLQRRDRTFTRGKSFDTFCPLGPAIAVAAALDDLEVVTRVNGEERQRGHTRDMAFSPVELVRYTAAVMTLEPGDVILTGTPAGVGSLQPGDRVEVEVSGVGTLSNPVVAAR